MDLSNYLYRREHIILSLKKQYIKGWNCRPHNMSCTREGIENHVASMEEKLGKGKAGCEIVEVYFPEVRKGSERTRERGVVPGIVSKLVREKTVDKEWKKILDKKGAFEVVSYQELLRKIKRIPKDSMTGGMIGGPLDTKGHGNGFDGLPDISRPGSEVYQIAKKFQKVESMTYGWIKAMVGNNHIPTKNQIINYRRKMYSHEGIGSKMIEELIKL